MALEKKIIPSRVGKEARVEREGYETRIGRRVGERFAKAASFALDEEEGETGDHDEDQGGYLGYHEDVLQFGDPLHVATVDECQQS